MDPRDEIRELLGQATEYLRYFREVGITNLGESAPPNIPVAVEPPAAVIQIAQAIPILTIDMPIKKDASSLFQEPSLFGESAPQAAARRETLEEIRADLGDCKRCKLWETRNKLVFGEGSPEARLMFIGEGPGADEDASGRPFVGRAGQLLTKMIEAINLKREDVYIANAVKSRPPGNRTPETDEVRACIPFLFRQIAAIQPKLIVALGNPAMQALLDTKMGITKMRGQFAPYPRDPMIKVLPTFHPAYLLRSPDKKREAWEDLKRVRAFLAGEIDS
jgi:uracil-DNA glycosylase family 4